MAIGLFIQRLPQILIFHRFLAGGEPATALPVGHPLGDALFDVLAVGGEDHVTTGVETLEPGDDRHHLHAVVGGEGIALGQLLAVLLIDQYGGIATGARIAQARSIRVECDLF